MKISGIILISCAALILALTSVSAVQRLDSIDDLKKINFGRSVPTLSLVLLHWFANTVTIDSYNEISLNFDPVRGDYGSHRYHNKEGLLPRGNNRYYTIGNIDQGRGLQFPSHIVNPRSEYAERNRARIIIRVRNQTIDQIYITQHYERSDNQGTQYDPDHTYLITTNLLRQIRQFSMNGDQQLLMCLRNRFGRNADNSQLRSIRSEWGPLTCLGLLLFIVIEETHSSAQRNNRAQAEARSEDSVVNMEDFYDDEVPFIRQSSTEENRNNNSCRMCGICILVIVVIVVAFLLYLFLT